MEDGLEVYQRPYDARRPKVTLDEAAKQLLGHVRAPLPRTLRTSQAGRQRVQPPGCGGFVHGL